MVRNLPAISGDARDVGLITVSGWSPGGGNGNPLQYSCLENPLDRSLAAYSPWGIKGSDTTIQLRYNTDRGGYELGIVSVQLRPTLFDPMDCSTPGLPVHHQLPAFTQTHVHRVGDAIQPSHPLSSPSPPAFNLSQHQGLFKWVSSSHQVAKLMEFQLQHQFFQWMFRTNFFRMDWLDLLAVQGTLKSLLQHHSTDPEMSLALICLLPW